MKAEKLEFLGKGADAAAQTKLILGAAQFPLSVQLTNVSTRLLVLAQARPVVMLKPNESIAHTCHNRGQVYDLVFGMVAIGDQLGQEKIGTVTVMKPIKGASK
jgi:hypothetical protein